MLFSGLNRICTTFVRKFSHLNSLKNLEHLDNRALLRVSGENALGYLQGLITNDMKHLLDGSYSMYAMFLNMKGRILYDTIIYKTPDKNTFLVECDKQAIAQLEKHLNMYKLRKPIEIDSVSDQYKVFALYTPDILMNTDGNVNSMGPMSINQAVVINETVLYRDPRLKELGVRVLAPSNALVVDELRTITNLEVPDPEKSYQKFRYSLGVAEGVDELPPGQCFPLESNLDYLHGVSFNKGCYIGQELTARTYHTGVIRKRLMPLFFNTKLTKFPEQPNIMVNDKKLGVVRGVCGNVGLALLRVEQVIDTTLNIDGVEATTLKPCWWPIELPKEKMNL